MIVVVVSKPVDPMKGTILNTLVVAASSAMSFWGFYKAWWQPDDLIEWMLDVYEDPGDFNRWLVKTGAMKWFNRVISTALFLGFLYIGFRYIAWLIS